MLPFLLLNVSMGTVNENEGVLKHTIISPLGTELDSQQVRYFAGETQPPGSQSVIVSRFSDFGFNYDSSSFGYSAQPYCRVGGQYKIRVTNDVRPPGASFNQESNLYYCKTTSDLLSEIRIPSSWQNSNLILYCNDGGFINFENLNFEVYTSQANIYKGCVLRNLDLNDRNVIFYGFESGNINLDKVVSTFDGEEGVSTQIVRNLNFVSEVNSNVYQFSDNSNSNYYLNFNPSNSFFHLSEFQGELTVPLLNIFNIPNDFGASRVANFRSFSNGRKAYGYENSLASRTDSNFGNSVYKIVFTNFAFFQNDCHTTLASYGAKIKDNLGVADTVVCPSTNEILINSRGTDSVYGRGVGYNLFKNIILDLE